MPDKDYSPQETLDLLAAKAKLPNGNDFTVKVNRRGSAYNGMLQQILTFDGVTVEQIASPELWLPRLTGGGKYSLVCYSRENLVAPIGGHLHFQFDGDPIPNELLNLDAVKSADYPGPKSIVFPPKNPPPYRVPGVMISSGGGGPPPAGAHTAANVVPNAGGPASPSSWSTQPAWVDHRYEALQTQVASLQTLLQQQESSRREEKLRAEYEDRLKSQAEQHRREREDMDRRFKELEMKINAPKTDTGKHPLAELAATLMPLVQSILAGQNDLRLAMLTKDKELGAENQKMLTSLLARPPIDPVMLELLRKGGDGVSAAAIPQMLGAIMESTTALQKQSVGLIEMMAEMATQGNDENPWVAGIRELANSFKSIAVASANAQRAALQGRMPQPLPAGNGATATAPQGFAGAPGQRPPQPGKAPPKQPTAADHIHQAILKHVDPTTVAQAIIAALDEPAFKKELEAAGDDPDVMLANRLGDWASLPEHQEYLKRLKKTLEELLMSAGFLDDGQGTEEEVGEVIEQE